MKESRNFELAHLKKKKEVVWRLSGWYFHDAFRATIWVFLVMKTVEDEWYIVISLVSLLFLKI